MPSSFRRRYAARVAPDDAHDGIDAGVGEDDRVVVHVLDLGHGGIRQSGRGGVEDAGRVQRIDVEQAARRAEPVDAEREGREAAAYASPPSISAALAAIATGFGDGFTAGPPSMSSAS